MMKRILFTGGGSAGHAVPNIALIQTLQENGKVDVCYMGTDGIEKQIVSEWNVPYFTIECPKLVRKGGVQGLKNNLRIPFRFVRAVQQAKRGLMQFRPNAVFSKGGYVALPVVYAASRMGIPCFAHESDFSPGLANKLSAKWCRSIFTSFPETASRFSNGVYSGAIVKNCILHANREEARAQFQLSQNERVLLVFGGGSGSKAINDAVRKHIQALTKTFTVFHICGKGACVHSRIKNYRQFEFIEDMGTMYALADVVVARSGAGTVFEIMTAKKPALFIPLAGQTRGDQQQNAEYFVAKGLCHILQQSKLDELPLHAQNTFADTSLKERLESVSLPIGNALILQTLLDTIQA